MNDRQRRKIRENKRCACGWLIEARSTRCLSCANAARPAATPPPNCIDCAAVIRRGYKRCKPCGHAIQRKRVPETHCACGAPIAGRSRQPSASKARGGKPPMCRPCVMRMMQAMPKGPPRCSVCRSPDHNRQTCALREAAQRAHAAEMRT